MSGVARVGCSGWSYDDWRGFLYPKDAKPSTWFARYAERFDTVEINNTFYRLPPPSTMESWAKQAPRGFTYALKLGQFGSHRKKLRDPESGWLDNHIDRVERLGGHLGPNLIQLPPRWKRNAARLDEFLDAAPRRIKWAVEVRDPSWLHDDVFDVLHRRKAALCIHDMIENHPWVCTTDWTYIRFHGPNATERKYVGRYGPRRLHTVANRLNAWLVHGVNVFAYFNNDTHGDAVRDATWLRDHLAMRRAAA